MSYKQPRVPEYREGEAAGSYARVLMLFLKDFTMAAWAANNRRKKEISALKARVDALSAGQGTEGR